MKALGRIFLAWRSGKGNPRYKVGIIQKDGAGVNFHYLISQEKATEIRFTPYTDFPDLSKKYTENVLDIFGQRLTKPERGDIQKYYDFWEIKPEYKNDKYYLLAHTQGLLATDNFEFLAEYSLMENLSFISEICGLSHSQLSPQIIENGDELRWKLDKGNEHDPKAVEVFKGDTFLGYVKIVHSEVFYEKGGDKLKIKVKSIDRNGHLNRVFIKIYNP
jgi:hypothetical protein